MTDTKSEKVLKTNWKKDEGIWVKKIVEEDRKETLAKRKEVNKKPKKILNLDLMKFKFVRNVVKNVEQSDMSEDKSEISGKKKIERKKTGRKETPVKKTPLKKVKPPRKEMNSRDNTIVNTPEFVKSNGGRASRKKVNEKIKENKKINLIKNYFSPVFARELSLPTDKLFKNDKISTKFTVMPGKVLPLNLNQTNGMVSIRNQDQISTAPEQQPIGTQRMPEDIVLTNEKPEMTFEKN